MSTMDVSGSAVDQPQSRNVNEFLSYISNKDIKSFKEGLKFIDPKDLSRVITETITIEERKEFFDVLLDMLEVTIKSDLSIFSNSPFYKQCIAAICNSSDTYYAIRLTEVYEHATPAEKGSLLCLAVHFENKLISHRLILSGADINGFNLMGTKPLKEAIECNNLELVCMLLYYGADVNLSHDLTAFTHSIICSSSEEIQRTLLEYVCDFNSIQDGRWTLYFAIKHNSPVTMEIIKRGADINYEYENYCDYKKTAISLAMLRYCDREVFRLLWNEFDYEVWKAGYGISVLLLFLKKCSEKPYFEEYLKVLIENETKLELDIDFHNNTNYARSRPIISTLYLKCVENEIDHETIESYVLHLLLHGAQVWTEDIDIIRFSDYANRNTPVLDMLLYMDLYDSNNSPKSIMYFKYTPIPDLQTFMSEHIKWVESPWTIYQLTLFYAIETKIQMPTIKAFHKGILERAATLPSLLQLARDGARERICIKYKIKSSCRLQTIVRNLGLPKIIQDILLFNKPIYSIHLKPFCVATPSYL